jgi:hypothetical protein
MGNYTGGQGRRGQWPLRLMQGSRPLCLPRLILHRRTPPRQNPGCDRLRHGVLPQRAEPGGGEGRGVF